MELIQAVCPGCGEAVSLDAARDFGFCTYCGTKIPISKSDDDKKEGNEAYIVEENSEDASNGGNACVETENAPQSDISSGNESKSSRPALKKPALIAIISAAAVVIVGLVLVFNVFVPNAKYQKGVELFQAGSYDEAIAIFTELDGYKDSAELKKNAEDKKEEMRINSIIADAKQLYDSGDKLGAYNLLLPEKANKTVLELLETYKKAILDEASSKIEWREDEMSDYHWAFPKNDDTIGFLPSWISDISDPYFTIYLTQHKTEPSQKKITLRINTEEFTEGFVPPVHPTTVRLRNSAGEIDIPIGLYDRDFEVGSYADWTEKIDVEITLEQANVIYDMFKSGEPVKMRFIGLQRTRDFTLENDEQRAISEIVEYINVVYALDE